MIGVKKEPLSWQVTCRVRKWRLGEAEPYEVVEQTGNVILDEGAGLLLDRLLGASATPLDAANAYLGVGDSNTAEAASQTGLLGASVAYKGMDPGYPQRSGRSATWRATFGTSEANFAWNEWTVANGSSNAATNLNRKVAALGTKTSAEVWEMTVTVTVN